MKFCFVRSFFRDSILHKTKILQRKIWHDGETFYVQIIRKPFHFKISFPVNILSFRLKVASFKIFRMKFFQFKTFYMKFFQMFFSCVISLILKTCTLRHASMFDLFACSCQICINITSAMLLASRCRGSGQNVLEYASLGLTIYGVWFWCSDIWVEFWSSFMY